MHHAGNGYAALLLEGVDGAEPDWGPGRNRWDASGRSILMPIHQTGLANCTLQTGPSLYREQSIGTPAGTLLSDTHTWVPGACLPIKGATTPAPPPIWTLT